MKMHLDCVPCIQRQVLQTTRLVTEDKALQEQILREVLQEILESNWTIRTTIMATKTQQIIMNLTENSDPYSVLKAKYNQLALDLYPKLVKLIQDSDNPFLTSLKLSIAGNIIDFGAPSSFDLNQTIKRVLETDLTVDHSDILQERLKIASHIAYLVDNTGEIVFDKLFLETIRNVNPLMKITLVVKKDPFLNDAMLSDVLDIGMNKIPKIEFYEVGPDRRDPDFIEFLESFDVVISKGQANFEDLKEYGFIFFLFIIKCEIMVAETGLPLGSTLAKIDEK